MTDYDRYIVDLAVTVLREVMEAPAKEQRPSTAIGFVLRLCCRTVRSDGPHQFWGGINSTHARDRSCADGNRVIE